jgi:CheY-like chemotaxis protein/nitrogen-specific signal transduction histidine kinase
MAQQLAECTAMAVVNAREYLAAKNAVRTREDLLGIVSHDLRNPLNVTLMKCAMMLRDSSGNAGSERLRRDVETIERATRRMDRLLKDLQDFSSIQTGHLAIERRSELAMELVNEVADSARTLAAKRKIEIEVQGIAEDLAVNCDRERVLQVCSNLLGNALKFTPEAGSVTLTATRGSEGLVFSVRDTGVGIDPDELPHVFQKYWRARSGTRGGVGLGLFISRALVTEHGGRIWGESEKGLGSTFTFTLPLGPASADIDARRILIVDDDVDLRRELGEVLTTEGRPVAFAADGRQALSYLRNNPHPALVLVDLMMPVMDGWEFCATVRADPELSHIPVVVLSCLERHEGNDGLTDGLTDGLAGYLRKPIQLEKLLDVVAAVAPGAAAADAALPAR